MINIILAIFLAPLLPGVINKTKAFFAGRNGPPILQVYFDLWKLLQKDAIYSRTTSWIFRASPMVGLAAILICTALLPFGGRRAVLAFDGDFLLFAYLLGLMRFFTVIGALDTGSAFEGMGASREVTFSALAEPALILGMLALVTKTAAYSVSSLWLGISMQTWSESGPVLALVAIAFFVVFLAENARIPVDDPTTHLELTMIHEVMVLDHAGVDLAFIEYGASLKLWCLGSLLVGLIFPFHNIFAALGGLIVLMILVGIIESAMARLRLLTVPQMLLGASAFSILAIVLVIR